MSTAKDFRPGGRDSSPGWPRVAVPYINGWINETKKVLALEGGMNKIAKLMADLKKTACGTLAEAAGPVPEVAQVMDVTLAKSAEQNYAFKGRKQYQPPGKPTKDSKTVEGPGAFEELEKDGECPKDGTCKCKDCGKNKTEALKGSMNKLSKVLEHWGKPNSAVAEADEPAAPAPAPEPEVTKPVDTDTADDEPGQGMDINVAIKDRLAHGVAEGVINSLAAVFGDQIDFNNTEVSTALDEIERQYTLKGKQFFSQLRAEAMNMGSMERDRAIRFAVRVFRELA